MLAMCKFVAGELVPMPTRPEESMRSLSVVPAPMMTVSARPAVPKMFPIIVLLEPVVSNRPACCPTQVLLEPVVLL